MAYNAYNIQSFSEVAESSQDPIIKAYCGLVAIELVLKEAVGLRDHNVPAAMVKFAHRFAVGHQTGCKVRLTVLSVQLQNDMARVFANSADGVAQSIPPASYPSLRYVRHASDGWPDPSTPRESLEKLALTVSQIRAYFRDKFEKKL